MLDFIQPEQFNRFPHRICITKLSRMSFEFETSCACKMEELTKIFKRLGFLIIIQVKAFEIIKGKERFQVFQHCAQGQGLGKTKFRPKIDLRSDQ